jgi:hypothetical protein
VCVECSIGKQKKPILFQVTEPSSIPYRTPSWRDFLNKRNPLSLMVTGMGNPLLAVAEPDGVRLWLVQGAHVQ